jgi:hypothetical protein
LEIYNRPEAESIARPVGKNKVWAGIGNTDGMPMPSRVATPIVSSPELDQ